MKKIIGISGLAGDGKDTICEVLEAFFKISGYQFQQISLADKLKQECSAACKEMFGIDPTSCSREDKDKIRDYIVFYAKVKRVESKGKHWTAIVDKIIKNDKVRGQDKKIYCIPDIRHAYYPEDEAQWIKSNKGFIIHVKKYEIQSFSPHCVKYSNPINQEEAFNTPMVEEIADFILEMKDCYPSKPTTNMDFIRAVSSAYDMVINSIEALECSVKKKKHRKFS